jgi:hypothetical protein
MRFIAVIALALLVGACTQYALVQPQSVTVKDALIVEPDIAWNRINQQDISGRSQTEIWTADGPLLNTLTFFAGIEDGKPLLVQNAEQERQRGKLPEFRKSMTATEIMELVESTRAKLSPSSITKTRNLRPEKFIGKDGFRFDMTFVGKDEVDREVTVIGTVHEGRLYLIEYQGTRLYHYDLRRQQAERIIQTARLPGPNA